MVGLVIFVLGAVVFWFLGVKGKNGWAAAIGIIMILASVQAWFPNFYPALVTLVMAIGGDFGDFFGSAFKQ